MNGNGEQRWGCKRSESISLRSGLERKRPQAQETDPSKKLKPPHPAGGGTTTLSMDKVRRSLSDI